MKKLLLVLLALALALGLCAASAESAPYAGGSGTEADPYQIATADQLAALASAVNDGSANGYPGVFFALTDDIDLAGIEWQPIGHLDLADQSNMSCMFMGILDGQGHTVSNMTFNSDYPVCGVGIVGMNLGEVKNLIVKNVSVSCTNDFSMAIGGVVGYNMGGSISNVTLTGENSIAGVN
jgi:The GLUG motif.